jgi:penicillin-binding protein 1C
MEIIYPREGARLYIPVEIDGSAGEAIFTATHRNTSSTAKIYWHLDNSYIGTTTEFHQMAFHPSAGKHTLTLVDEEGEEVQVTFEILQKKEKGE